ncbi:MAG: LuxR C-terminal-related transcriptional regulator [Thermomicrobiales bacterium]
MRSPQLIPTQVARPAWTRYRPGTSFIGRDDECAAIIALVRDPDVPLITLLGPGGVGKTRLALHLLERLEMDGGEIEGTFVPLAMLSDPADTLPAIARALHIEEQGTRPLDGLIAQQLAGSSRPQVLVLDNAEQVAASMGFLPGLLAACPLLTVVVTSRTVLRFSAEHIVPVAPLLTRDPAAFAEDDALSPAAALFIERAGAVRPDFVAGPDVREAIEAICVQLDGLPLAIELAAARSRFFTPQALLRRISDRLQILTDGPRDAPKRHRTLRALLTWSHDLLDPDARILFRRLGIFAGSASLPAVEAVCNARGDLECGTEVLLTQLADQSLIRIDHDQDGDPDAEPRIRMLQTIRDFSREQLAFSGEEPTLQRAHAAWFADLTRDVPFAVWRTGSPEAEERARRYYPDVANFAAALEFLREEDPAEAVQMTLGLCVFWLEIGQVREGYARIAQILPHATVTPDTWMTRCTLLRVAALLASISEQHDLAFLHLREAEALAREHGSARLQAVLQGMIATATFRSGDQAAGERLMREAYDHAIAIGEPALAASLQASLGEFLLEAGKLEAAEPLLEEGVRILAATQEPAAGLYAGSLARVVLWRGDLDRAARLFREGMDYHRRPPYRQAPGRAAGFVGIAGLALERGRPEEAARLLGAAERVCIQLGEPDLLLEAFGYPTLREHLDLLLGEEPSRILRRDGARWTTPQALEAALAVTWLEGEAASHRPAVSGPGAATTAPGPEPSDRGEALTARERDILTHLAQGKTNEAIAAALFISPRTVTTHVTRIYAKLGVSNRAEAVAFALAHDLSDRGTAS